MEPFRGGPHKYYVVRRHGKLIPFDSSRPCGLAASESKKKVIKPVKDYPVRSRAVKTRTEEKSLVVGLKAAKVVSPSNRRPARRNPGRRASKRKYEDRFGRRFRDRLAVVKGLLLLPAPRALPCGALRVLSCAPKSTKTLIPPPSRRERPVPVPSRRGAVSRRGLARAAVVPTARTAGPREAPNPGGGSQLQRRGAVRRATGRGNRTLGSHRLCDRCRSNPAPSGFVRGPTLGCPDCMRAIVDSSDWAWESPKMRPIRGTGKNHPNALLLLWNRGGVASKRSASTVRWSMKGRERTPRTDPSHPWVSW